MRAAPARQRPGDLELDLARELEALLQPERQVQPALPRVTSVRLVNTGSTHPDNCVPMDLGVGIGGTATNGIELQFRSPAIARASSTTSRGRGATPSGNGGPASGRASSTSRWAPGMTATTATNA